MNLREIQEALIEQAARSLTLANELGKLLGTIEQVVEKEDRQEVVIHFKEVDWKELDVGDQVRVTMKDGSVVCDVVGDVERENYKGDMPFYLEGLNEWVGTPSCHFRTRDLCYVTLEKLVVC